MAKRPSVAKLADELFAKVEYDQGVGFVSDGMGAIGSHEAFFNAVRSAHKHTAAAERKMRAFLKKYGELPPSGRGTSQDDQERAK